MVNSPLEAPTVLLPTTVDPSPAVSSLLESEIVESAPKTMKKRVRLVLEKLKADPTTQWNERGEFVYNGVPIRGSNMVDLVNDVLRKRKASSPVGWESFARHLRHLNTLMEFIGNPDRRDYMLTRTNADTRRRSREPTRRPPSHTRRPRWDAYQRKLHSYAVL